jgi:SAM-dependent methyltransferase
MEDAGQSDRIREEVREYYGKELKGSSDLKTNACKCGCGPSKEIKDIIPLIDDEILDRFYGCGSPIPPLLDGLTVLDLGCGTGRDVYIASKLVGENGHVIGVDMTREQLDIAEAHIMSQMEKFGYSEPNVEFRQGYIEDLRSVGIENESIDVVISNCVVNLSPRKDLVLSEIHRVLKKGGELYFSDVFADRRIPDDVSRDPVLRGECLGGTMYVEDFRRAMEKAGFQVVRYTSVCGIEVDDPEMEGLLGDVRFTSRTVRAFKLDDLEDECEDYGQTVVYDGRIPGHPDYFDMDDGHRFYAGRPEAVCGNTASMCSGTRYGKHLRVRGDRSHHYGKFDCCGGPKNGGGCCC